MPIDPGTAGMLGWQRALYNKLTGGVDIGIVGMLGWQRAIYDQLTGGAVIDANGRLLLAGDRAYTADERQSARRTTPILVRRSQGVVAAIFGHQAAVGYGGRVVSVDNAGTFHAWTAPTGWNQVSSTGVLAGTTSVWFVDSRGYHFYAASSATALSRSTDHGATWQTSLTMPDPDDRVAPMCEDELGNLYAAAYGSGGAGQNSGTVWKSADGGATWAQIGAADITPNVARHVHGCWWDPFRALLFVTVGDAGDTSDIYVSDDRGASFTRWTNSRQCTAVAFTADYVLMAADQSSDRRIYRAAGATVAELVATTPQVCLDWVVDRDLPNNTSATHGYAWSAVTDESGNVVFMFGIEGTRTSVVASADGGDTWAEVAGSPLAAGRTFHEAAQVSRYNTTRDGWRYGLDTPPAVDTLSQWRVYAPGQALSIAHSATYTNGDGVALPCSELIDHGQRAPGLIQRLTADYAQHALVTMPYAVIGPGGYTFGQRATPPLVVENFDAVTAPALPAAWTTSRSGTGATPVTSAAQQTTGANSILCALTAGAGNSQVRLVTAPWALVAGDTAWIAADFRVSAIGAGATALIEFCSIRVNAVEREGVKRLELQNTASGSNHYQTLSDVVAMPLDTWVRVKTAITLAPNTVNLKNGRVRVWQDSGTGYVLVLDVIGIPTYSGSIDQRVFFGGNQGGSGPETSIYIDRIKQGTQDPEGLAPYVLTGVSQLVVGGASR